MTVQANETAPGAAIEKVASGQRMVIFAIILNIVGSIVANNVDPLLGLLIGLVAVVLAIVGLLRLSDGLGYSTGKKILLVILAFIPLVSLVMLVIVNARANEALKAAGYKVGLLGAKNP